MFLTHEELQALTGRARKRAQMEALRTMRIAFRINADGRPVVTRSAVEGVKDQPQAREWAPGVMG